MSGPALMLMSPEQRTSSCSGGDEVEFDVLARLIVAKDEVDDTMQPTSLCSAVELNRTARNETPFHKESLSGQAACTPSTPDSWQEEKEQRPSFQQTLRPREPICNTPAGALGPDFPNAACMLPLRMECTGAPWAGYALAPAAAAPPHHLAGWPLTPQRYAQPPFPRAPRPLWRAAPPTGVTTSAGRPTPTWQPPLRSYSSYPATTGGPVRHRHRHYLQDPLPPHGHSAPFHVAYGPPSGWQPYSRPQSPRPLPPGLMLAQALQRAGSDLTFGPASGPAGGPDGVDACPVGSGGSMLRTPRFTAAAAAREQWPSHGWGPAHLLPPTPLHLSHNRPTADQQHPRPSQEQQHPQQQRQLADGGYQLWSPDMGAALAYMQAADYGDSGDAFSVSRGGAPATDSWFVLGSASSVTIPGEGAPADKPGPLYFAAGCGGRGNPNSAVGGPYGIVPEHASPEDSGGAPLDSSGAPFDSGGAFCGCGGSASSSAAASGALGSQQHLPFQLDAQAVAATAPCQPASMVERQVTPPLGFMQPQAVVAVRRRTPATPGTGQRKGAVKTRSMDELCNDAPALLPAPNARPLKQPEVKQGQLRKEHEAEVEQHQQQEEEHEMVHKVKCKVRRTAKREQQERGEVQKEPKQQEEQQKQQKQQTHQAHEEQEEMGKVDEARKKGLQEDGEQQHQEDKEKDTEEWRSGERERISKQRDCRKRGREQLRQLRSQILDQEALIEQLRNEVAKLSQQQ